MTYDQTDKRIAADILIAALTASTGNNSSIYPLHQQSPDNAEMQSQNIAKAFEIIYQSVKNPDKSQ